MYITSFLFNLKQSNRDISGKKKKKIILLQSTNKNEPLVEEIIQQKPILRQNQIFIQKYNNIDYANINMNYFINKAIKEVKVKTLTAHDFGIFSLLQHEILYNDFLIKKFVNCLIKDGKKFFAYKTFEYAICFLKKKIHRHPLFFLRYFLHLSEQCFDYKEVRAKRTNKVLFIIPKCIEGNARWLIPLKIWISEFYRDQIILYKFPFFRPLYLRVAFTLFRICKTHSFFVQRIVKNKSAEVSKHQTRIEHPFENKKKKRLRRYLKGDNNTKWNWVKGRNWKEYNKMSSLKITNSEIWSNTFFNDNQSGEFIRGAVKTNPRRLKKKHVLSSYQWFR